MNPNTPGNGTPHHKTTLHSALDWWAGQDDMGGFKAAAAALFPGWRARSSCRAPHRKDRSASFSIYRNGRSAWRFKDHASGEQGGLVGFVMLAGRGKKEAVRWLIEASGNDEARTLVGTPAFRHSGFGLHSDFVIRHSSFSSPMPAQAMAEWNEGVDHLESHPLDVAALAQQRGWPVEFAQHLVDCAVVSMLLYHGRRGIAFLVSAPENFAHRSEPHVSHTLRAEDSYTDSFTAPIPSYGCGKRKIVMRDIGFHCRLQERCGQKRTSWRFVPNPFAHGRGIPALPFIIGSQWFATARLLVITEGQWDALTFAHAAGWLGKGCHWPAGVCVIGIRGASGTGAFLQAYAQYWPGGADCLLLPDGDGPGARWFQGEDSFAGRLLGLCKKVAVEPCTPHKDFNDLYRARQITPQEIALLLARNGIALENEATL